MINILKAIFGYLFKKNRRSYLRYLEHRLYNSRFLLNISSFFVRIEKKPIFILGNYKSGTTVITELLSLASGEKATNDAGLGAKLDIKSNKLPEVIKNFKLVFSRKIIKDPYLTYYFDDLKKEFPEAKFIFIVRNPVDNIRSILDRNKLPGDLNKLPKEKMNGIPWSGLFDTESLEINAEHYIDILAYRWNIATDVYINSPDSFICLKYEDFIQDREEQIYDLVKKSGLRKKKLIGDYVHFQHKSKGRNKTVDPVEFYGDNLSRIMDICGEKAKKLSYLL